MIGTTMKRLLVALLAAFTLASNVEAAPKKVRHRTKHSTRVTSGAAATTGTTATPAKKDAATPKARAGARAKRSTAKTSAAKRSTAKKGRAKKSTGATGSPAKRRPMTKPR